MSSQRNTADYVCRIQNTGLPQMLPTMAKSLNTVSSHKRNTFKGKA